jgi:predicted XRE-type DNA-binding protein
MLKQTLLYQNIKQKDIAKHLNISESAVSKFKKGKLILSEVKQGELYKFLLNL